MKKDDLSKRYDYRVDVQEGRAGISYFTDSIDLSKATFVTFAPRYRLAGRGGLDEEVKGQILTFPSHLIKKITNHIHT